MQSNSLYVSHVIILPGSPLSFPFFVLAQGEPGNEAKNFEDFMQNPRFSDCKSISLQREYIADLAT